MLDQKRFLKPKIMIMKSKSWRIFRWIVFSLCSSRCCVICELGAVTCSDAESAKVGRFLHAKCRFLRRFLEFFRRFSKSFKIILEIFFKHFLWKTGCILLPFCRLCRVAPSCAGPYFLLRGRLSVPNLWWSTAAEESIKHHLLHGRQFHSLSSWMLTHGESGRLARE